MSSRRDSKRLDAAGWYTSYLRSKGNKKCGTELHFIFRKRGITMYLFFTPALAALTVIALIQLRDQFRFTSPR
jgi:hypothetical protein